MYHHHGRTSGAWASSSIEQGSGRSLRTCAPLATRWPGTRGSSGNSFLTGQVTPPAPPKQHQQHQQQHNTVQFSSSPYREMEVFIEQLAAKPLTSFVSIASGTVVRLVQVYSIRQKRRKRLVQPYLVLGEKGNLKNSATMLAGTASSNERKKTN